MKKFTQFLDKHSPGKKVLLLFILTNIVYVFMLTVTIPRTMNFSDGMALLDMMPTGYDLNYVTDLFNALGKEGRQTYLTNQLPVDMLYPFLFGLSYSLLLAYFLKKLNKLKRPFTYLCLLPVLAGLADYAENFGIINLLNSYPELTETVVKTTNTFSIIKSMATSVFFAVLIIVLVLLGVKTIGRKKHLP